MGKRTFRLRFAEQQKNGQMCFAVDVCVVETSSFMSTTTVKFDKSQLFCGAPCFDASL